MAPRPRESVASGVPSSALRSVEQCPRRAVGHRDASRRRRKRAVLADGLEQAQQAGVDGRRPPRGFLRSATRLPASAVSFGKTLHIGADRRSPYDCGRRAHARSDLATARKRCTHYAITCLLAPPRRLARDDDARRCVRPGGIADRARRPESRLDRRCFRSRSAVPRSSSRRSRHFRSALRLR